MNNVGMLISFGVWVAQIFYFICLIPQIMTNYKIKSGDGISELLLIGYFNGYWTFIYYAFCLNLPLAYKVTVPFAMAATLVLIFQRLYYQGAAVRKTSWALYGINIIVAFLFIPIAFKNPQQVGHFFGWVTTMIGAVTLLPQVLKVHVEKSVKGFNFLFIFFTALAALVEVVVARVLLLPAQTVLGALREIAFFFIFSIQFLLYKQ